MSLAGYGAYDWLVRTSASPPRQQMTTATLASSSYIREINQARRAGQVKYDKVNRTLTAAPGHGNVKTSLIQRYGPVVPTPADIALLTRYTSALGVWAHMVRAAYIPHLLVQAGVDVFATDAAPHPCPWMHVHLGTATRMAREADPLGTIMFTPPQDIRWRPPKVQLPFGGHQLIYIGPENPELPSYRTLLDQFDEHYPIIESVPVLSWDYTPHVITVYKRRVLT
jgi:hypothetical protein